MYETDSQNHKFAQQFTQAVNEERKAEAGNRGEAHPPKYELVTMTICHTLNNICLFHVKHFS